LEKTHYMQGAGVTTGYGLDDQGIGIRVLVESKIFPLSLLHVVQTGSGVHPTSYPKGTGSFFPGDKVAEA
jgi:hypothetical protein